MHLSTKSAYSIRALTDIAYNEKNGPVLIKNIAKRQGIEISYLEQLLNRLKKKGLIKAKRGPGGGYILAKKPSKISIYDVILAQGDKIVPVSCLEQTCCPQIKTCFAHKTWKKMYKDIEKELKQAKISKLIKNHGKK